jgi:hypothetical protein
MPVLAVIRASYVLECAGHGARETWFFQQSSDNLDTAIQTWETTLDARRLLVGAQGQVKAIELSIETGTDGNPFLGDSVISYQYLNGYTQEDMADPELALLFKNQTATRQRRRNSYLRLIWDSIEIQGGKYIVPQGSTWQTKLQNWKAKMLAIPVGYLQGTRGAQVPLVSYTQEAGGQVSITFGGNIFAALPIGSKQRIRIYSARQSSQLAGQQIVIINSATTCTTVDKIAVLDFTGVGWTGSVYTYAFQQTPFMDDQKIVRRKIGRPLLVSAGRARARART